MTETALQTPEDRKAATIIVEVVTEQGSLVALAAVDPRWRVDREGRHRGLPALRDGALTPLPLTGLKFIGGLVDEAETPLESALRELGEEAGARIAAAVRATGVREVYRMTRGLEWAPNAKTEITYFHARVRADASDLPGLFEPADDCLAIVLVGRDRIVLADEGYVVTGAAAVTFWRKAFVPVPYEGWAPSEAQEAAFKAYNAAGREDPFAGIDKDSLAGLHVPLFYPTDASPTDILGGNDLLTGRPLPDGAVLAHAFGGIRFAGG